MTALVTGAGGFIGGAVLSALAKSGVEPKALVRSRPRSLPKGATAVKGTLDAAGKALDGVTTVFHFAYDIRAGADWNLADFDAFLAAMAHAGVETLVHASSIVVHDGWPFEDLNETSPVTPPGDDSYRAAKIAMEARIRGAVAKGDLARAVILRPTLVYGPGSRMWTEATVHRLKAGPVLLPEPPEDHPESAPFGLCHICHVEDLAHAAIRGAELNNTGVETFILSNPEPPDWERYYRGHIDAIGEGEVRRVPYEKLAALVPDPVPAGSGPTFAAALSSNLRRVVGSRVVDGLAARVRSLRPAPTGEQVPDRFLFDLYSTTGRLDVSRARNMLDFRPEEPFEARIRDMSASLSGP